jgi:hypothetical protein
MPLSTKLNTIFLGADTSSSVSPPTALAKPCGIQLYAFLRPTRILDESDRGTLVVSRSGARSEVQTPLPSHRYHGHRAYRLYEACEDGKEIGDGFCLACVKSVEVRATVSGSHL